MKTGRTKAIFGVVGLSAVVVYSALSSLSEKRGLITALVETGSPVPDADILVFGGLPAFLENASHIHSDMVSIVCAGPLQCASLPEVRPLDYRQDVSYIFTLQTPDYKKVFAALKEKKSVPVRALTLDHLSMIIDNTVSGGEALPAFTALFSMCNAAARNSVRRVLVRYILKKVELQAVNDVLDSISDSNIKDRVSALKGVLQGEYFTRLVTTLRQARSSKSNLTSLAKKNELDQFELNYFNRMVADTIKISKKSFVG